jgi:hypothetical protein
VTWNGTDAATLTITPADVADLEPGYRSEEHLPDVDVVIGATAYPGILDAEGATIDLTGT